MSASTRAILTAAAAAALAVGAFVGHAALLAVVAVVVAVFAYGWPALLDLPWLWGSRTVLAVIGVGALAVGVLAPDAGVGMLPFVVAIGVILAFVSEMLRRDGRHRVVESLCGVVTGVVAVSCVAGWPAAASTVGGQSLVVAAAACIAVASAVSAALPWDDVWIAGVCVAAGILVGAGSGALLANLEVLEGIWAGLVAGVVVASLYVLFDRLPGIGVRAGAAAAGVLPVLLGGMLTYVVGTIVV